MKPAYYNEFDPYAAAWLRNLIAAGLIAAGDVDTRSIVDVAPDDLTPYGQCHFFAGIGGWSLACRLAGWPDDREIWTGSCPCQPFSVAGKRGGTDDVRHLWPDFLRLIGARRPDVVMGEQVAAAVGANWIDGVLSDVEGIGYTGRAIVIPACAVNGPHRRDRLWFVARDGVVGDGERTRLEGHTGYVIDRASWALANRSTAEASGSGALVDDPSIGRGEGWAESELWSGRTTAAGAGVSCGDVANGDIGGRCAGTGNATAGHGQAIAAESWRSPWDSSAWIVGHDNKARRIPVAESGVRLLANGVPARVGKLRAYGNAIVPQVAAEVIAAMMETQP